MFAQLGASRVTASSDQPATGPTANPTNPPAQQPVPPPPRWITPVTPDGTATAGQPAMPGKQKATGRPHPSRRAKGGTVANPPVATRVTAEADLIRLLAAGHDIPCQKVLAARWGCHKGTCSKWLDGFERRGLIARRWDGRHNVIVGPA